MDESRFANFGAEFGFDNIITPSTGTLDFLVGSSYDLIATNLLLIVPLVNRALPHVHANRAAYRTYRHNDHPTRIANELRHAPSDQPLFLVSHLTLPHWPYLPPTIMDDDLQDFSTDDPEEDGVLLPYRRSLHAADSQFERIFTSLNRSGRLRNALVIVLSDHGESFPISRDNIQFQSDGRQEAMEFFGHGTSVLSTSQNRIVLAFQKFAGGRPTWPPRSIYNPVSVEDIAPTIADFLDIFPEENGFDGISLRPALEGAAHAHRSRPRFLESGIRSTGIEKVMINEREVAEELSHLYEITSDFRFEISRKHLPSKLSEKHRAALRDGLIVAAVPKRLDKPEPSGCWIVLNVLTQKAKCTDFPSDIELVSSLQHETCTFYEKDRIFHQEWCQYPRRQHVQ